MTTADFLKIAAILLAVGGGIARIEYRMNQVEARLTVIESTADARARVLERATDVLERWETPTLAGPTLSVREGRSTTSFGDGVTSTRTTHRSNR